MEAFSRGWGFLKQAWQMAVADRDLIKPSIYNLLVGFVLSLVGLVPMIGVFLLLDLSQLPGQIAFALAGAVMVFLQFIVTYLFSAMTIYLIFGYLSEGDGRMDKAWAIVKRDFLDILSLAAVSTLVNLVKDWVRGKGRSAGRNLLAGLISTVWTEAAFLILPAMVIEDINLKDGLKRAGQIIKDNLLLVGVSTVGVKTVTGLIGFLLGFVGLGLGGGLAYLLVLVLGTGTTGLVIGIGLGVLVFFISTTVASIISSYTGTAYHACLYLWAREVEKARAAGRTTQVAAPAPLAAVLK